MLETLITSKTRLKLLLKFFLNSNKQAWLRSLETEFGESTNAIRLELNRLEKAKMLTSVQEGNKKLYQANINHPLYPEIHKLIIKYVGLDEVIDKVVNKLGQLDEVYLVGELARGNNSKMVDLWLVGEDVDKSYLLSLVEKAEKLIERKIRYILLNRKESKEFLLTKEKDELLLIWNL